MITLFIVIIVLVSDFGFIPYLNSLVSLIHIKQVLSIVHSSTYILQPKLLKDNYCHFLCASISSLGISFRHTTHLRKYNW